MRSTRSLLIRCHDRGPPLKPRARKSAPKCLTQERVHCRPWPCGEPGWLGGVPLVPSYAATPHRAQLPRLPGEGPHPPSSPDRGVGGLRKGHPRLVCRRLLPGRSRCQRPRRRPSTTTLRGAQPSRCVPHRAGQVSRAGRPPSLPAGSWLAPHTEALTKSVLVPINSVPRQ